MNYNRVCELTATEFDSLTDGDWEQVFSESFGDARAYTTNEIIRSGDIYAQVIEEYGFGEFVTRYYQIEFIS